MQRDTKKSKVATPELTPEQLRQQEAEAITHEASINAYYAAQKPPVIGQNPFDSLPSDVLGKIAGEDLPISGARRFVRACPSLFYCQDRREPVLKRVNNEVRQFLLHVKNGNLEAATTMLEKDPELILEERTVGEHKRVSALLLAKRMGDAGMCQMLQNRLQAFDAQFGDDQTSPQIRNVSANSQKKAPFDVRYFDLVANAIAEYPSDVAAELTRHRRPPDEQRRTTLSHVMNACRIACDAHGEFTAEDMINVFDALARNAEKFKTREQFDLFFVQVMGYVARKLPLCLRMALNQGIFEMLRDNNVVNLDRQTTHDVNGATYSLVDFTLTPNSGLGFDFAFDISRVDERFAARGIGSVRWSVRRAQAALGDFQKFCRATESALVELNLCSSQPEEVKSSRCVIC